MTIVDLITAAGAKLAQASNGNPAVAVATVGLFYLLFNFVEATVEKVIFGERFEHFLDPLFGFAFIVFAGYSVVACAIHNSK